MNSKLDKGIPDYAVAALFCGGGIFMWFRYTFLSGFDMIQGELGDTRLNNYFLEHSFQLLVNPDYSGALWSPSFFYPAQEVLAYSDNLFGSAPIYWLFRFITSAPTAFQLWMIVVCALNFFSFFVALRYLKIDKYFSGLGAFLFAFGLPRAGQFGHSQMLPQFFTPLALLAAFLFVRKPSRKLFLVLLVCCYLQVLSGIYLGWFLLFSLPIFFLITYAFNWEALREFLIFLKKERIFMISSILGWIILNFLTLLPYIKHSLATGGRSYQEVDTMIPRVASWFSAPPGTFLYSLTSKFSAKLPTFWEHYMFMGFTVCALVIVCIISLRQDRNRLHKDDRWFIYSCFFTFSFLFLLSLRFPFGFSLWSIVYKTVPGASAIRAVTRICTIAYCYLLFGLLSWLSIWVNSSFRGAKRILVIALICCLSISEQFVVIGGFSKDGFNQEVFAIEKNITSDCDIAYFPIFPDNEEDSQQPRADKNLLPMWAGINANVPVVNGFSGDRPPNYGDNSKPMSTSQVLDWLETSSKSNNMERNGNMKLCFVGPESLLSKDDLLKSFGTLARQGDSHNFSLYKIELPFRIYR